ncbi:MAG: Autophagy protein 22 [Claussenomyces sp. TS43310]|nr:MAG: Autophagy protein 22 [Claussenomyces sp. TS43310]
MVPRQPQFQRPLPYRMLSTNSTKRSFLSHSSSFEADDERSSSADYESMGPDSSAPRLAPQYAGEDTRLTSRRELWGWYAYGFAAEVFVICGIGSFIPITLEQLSRENGVLLSDRSTPCIPKPADRDPLALLHQLVSPSTMKDNGQCVIYFLGVEINTASFALYIFSISVLLQALVVVSISCAADHGNYRKRLLLGFAFTGAFATMLFLVIVPEIYLLGALLAIISNTCFGASFVLLNSFLPVLVRRHPATQYPLPEIVTEAPHDVLQHQHLGIPNSDGNGNADQADATTPLLPASEALPEEKATSVELTLATQISSTGIGIGYSAGLFVQCISILVILSLHSTTFSLRLVLFIIGVWWFLFTIPAAVWLRPRPGPLLPLDSKTGAARTWVGYVVHSWVSLYRTLTQALRLRDISLFLMAWFLLSDAIATVSSTAILFAKTQLQMAAPALGLINVIVTAAGILGAFSWSTVSRYFNLRPTRTILACLCLFELIPLYGLLAYIPGIQRLGFLGLQQPWEMYPLGFVYGLVLGGLSSYCRALFGELIPPGSEAAFYALYAITDKGSSVFGPAIVGFIIDRTGEVRAAFWFLAVLVGLPAPIIYLVNVDRGRREAATLAELIEGFKILDAGNGASDVSREADDSAQILDDAVDQPLLVAAAAAADDLAE